MNEKSSMPQMRPLIDFEIGLRNQKRKSGGGGRSKELKDVVEHGNSILENAKKFAEIIEIQLSKRDPDLPQLSKSAQLIMETEGLTPSDISKLGLRFIEERDEGIFVTIAPDSDISTVIKKTQTYIEDRTKDNKPKFSNIIDPILNFRPSTVEDKISENLLRKISQMSSGEVIQVEVELSGGRTEDGEQNRLEFSNYVRDLNKHLPEDTPELLAYFPGTNPIVEPEYSIHRVVLPIFAIWDLLSNSNASWITSIDSIPEYEEDLIRLKDISNDSIPPISTPDDDSPRLVIIDSGIATGHPLFRDTLGNTIIGRQRNFLPNSNQSDVGDEIEDGHGTGVASVAAYFSLKEFLLDTSVLQFPSFWIENAKILLPESLVKFGGNPKNPTFHPNLIPKDAMRQIVRYFHIPLPEKCKVFNLSIGSAPHRLKNWISNWAEEIDNLTAHNDILFVISSGNVHINNIKNFLDDNKKYPEYLLDVKSRLRNPAQAYSAICVGSISNNDLTTFQNTYLGCAAIAPLSHPSPFSRSGLLIDGIVKPDVVEVGGNLAITEIGMVRELNELSIPVAHREFIDKGVITFNSGTSLSAPRVSNIALKVQTQNPTASANLIRALIINSAEWPKMFENAFSYPINPLGATREDVITNTLRLCGYGIPQVEKALSANSNCLLFTIEDFLSWDEKDKTEANTYPGKVSFYTIRMDGEDIKRNLPPSTPIRVKITLAFNPQVRKNYRRYYQGVKIRWDLRKVNQPIEEFKSQWIQESVTFDSDETLSDNEEKNRKKYLQYPWILKPILNPRNMSRRGTVISDWFECSSFELADTFDIAVLGNLAPWIIPPEEITQHFALVVSIESKVENIPIYDLIRIRNRIQVKAS